jgi:hypothetical protein
MDRNCSRIKSTLAVFGCSLLASTVAQAAEVTYERILNPEPGNWLTHHHDLSAQRYSTLDAISKTNIKNHKLAFAAPARAILLFLLASRRRCERATTTMPSNAAPLTRALQTPRS